MGVRELRSPDAICCHRGLRKVAIDLGTEFRGSRWSTAGCREQGAVFFSATCASGQQLVVPCNRATHRCSPKEVPHGLGYEICETASSDIQAVVLHVEVSATLFISRPLERRASRTVVDAETIHTYHDDEMDLTVASVFQDAFLAGVRLSMTAHYVAHADTKGTADLEVDCVPRNGHRPRRLRDAQTIDLV